MGRPQIPAIKKSPLHASPSGYSSRRYSTNQTKYSCPGPGSMYKIFRIVEVPYTVCLWLYSYCTPANRTYDGSKYGSTESTILWAVSLQFPLYVILVGRDPRPCPLKQMWGFGVRRRCFYFFIFVALSIYIFSSWEVSKGTTFLWIYSKISCMYGD